MRHLRLKTDSRPQVCEISVGHGSLAQVGVAARKAFGSGSTSVAIISNDKVFPLYGEIVNERLRASGFKIVHLLMPDGERYKTLRTIETLIHFLAEQRFDRAAGIVALGGGIVGDVAGLAAAVYLRGIPFIQIPTTLVAQIDASIGGKTGVNLTAGKNLIGSFHQPRAVVIDVDTLKTLPRRELVSGWCEAIKQGAVGSHKLFDQTYAFLKNAQLGTSVSSPQLERLISAHCAFKASIVTADEREDLTRTDYRSRRTLNFGHTVGHALEVATAYRRFRHGEAVGHGMLVAGEISKKIGLLDQSELELLREAIRTCGPRPRADDVDGDAILSAITQDKKRSGNDIQWVLLERIGRARIVNGKEVSRRLLLQSLRAGLRE